MSHRPGEPGVPSAVRLIHLRLVHHRVEQISHDVSAAHDAAKVVGGAAVAVELARICAGFNEPAHYVGVAALGGNVDRRLARAVCLLRILVLVTAVIIGISTEMAEIGGNLGVKTPAFSPPRNS